MTSKPAAVLLQELQSLKAQETALTQILQKCAGCMNKLKVEELHLKSILREENAVASQATGEKAQDCAASISPGNGMISPQNFLAKNNDTVDFAPFTVHME